MPIVTRQVERLAALPERVRHGLFLAILAVLVFFPYLGAVGFWDPWEPEYDEVAREMIARQDFIHPYYLSGYFLSKPVFTFWLMALGQILAGGGHAATGIPVETEWCVRSLVAGLAVIGILMTYLATGRTIGHRAGVWTGAILITSPFYFLLARQTMPDMPFTVLNTAGLACLMIAVFEKEYVQDGWLYAFYALAGLACLAKGLLGIALPGAAMLLYLVVSGDWRLLARLRLVTGPLVTLAVMGPWYGTMLVFPGVDYEDGTSFFWRFIVHDHLQRAEGSVHTTTPNTTFVYYIEQLGFGLFPWVAFLPGALAAVLAHPIPAESRSRRDRAILFVASWAASTFLFFSLVGTKFHHYGFPAVPALSILLGLFVDRVLREGVSRHSGALLAGFGLYVMVAQNLATTPKHLIDLFVYNYDRPYPVHEIDQAPIFSLGSLVVTPERIFALLFALAPLVALRGAPGCRRWLAVMLRRAPRGSGEWSSDRLFIIGAVATLAICFAVFVSGWQWRKLSAHWTQRDLFWTYHERAAQSEAIGAYQMNWHGETFYSQNTARQMKDPGELREFVSTPGRQWLLIEVSRLRELETLLGSGYRVTVEGSTNKFLLLLLSRR